MNAAALPSLVALQLRAGPGWLPAAEAIWDSGDAVLPVPADASQASLTRAMRAFRPSAIVTATGREELDGGVGVEPGTAVVIATSGSTGDPKGVVLSHAALTASATASLDRLGATASDRWLCCLPLDHVAGLQVLLRSKLAGVEPVVHERFSVNAVAAERDVAFVSPVPTMLRRLLDAHADLRHLKAVLLGGAAPGAQLLDDAARAGMPVVTTYGMTETSGGCVYDGRRLDCAEIAIQEEDADTGAGRIYITGPMLFSGYRLRADLTSAAMRDQWLRTNDLGRIVDGRLEVLGRADDVIVTGGRNVSGDWIAQLLERHPNVVEAAVAGREDREWGQRVVAFVVPRDHQVSLEEVRRYLSGHAPAYAAPRELVLLDELPRLPNGKVDRIALASHA